jgi:hypothetical protein
MTDSQRLKNIVTELVNNKKIKNERDLCNKLGFPTGNIAKIKSGERKIPASLKLALIKEFNINEEYLSNDALPIVSAEKTPQIENIAHPQPGGEVWSTMITAVTTALNVLSSDNSTFKKIIEDMRTDKNTYRSIIETGIGKGAVKFDLKKAGVDPE